MARTIHARECPRSAGLQRLLSAQDCSFCEVAEAAYARGRAEEKRDRLIEKAETTVRLCDRRLAEDPSNATLQRIRARALATLAEKP